MIDNYQQNATGSMTYPVKGTFNRFLFKSPLYLWRMGLGPLLSHPAMGGSKMLALTTLRSASSGLISGTGCFSTRKSLGP